MCGRCEEEANGWGNWANSVIKGQERRRWKNAQPRAQLPVSRAEFVPKEVPQAAFREVGDIRSQGPRQATGEKTRRTKVRAGAEHGDPMCHLASTSMKLGLRLCEYGGGVRQEPKVTPNCQPESMGAGSPCD